MLFTLDDEATASCELLLGRSSERNKWGQHLILAHYGILNYIWVLRLISGLPVPVQKTLLFCEPVPCNPAAKTAIQPLI